MNILADALPRLVSGTEEELVPGPQLAESLRDAGYSYWTAIDELNDNAIDACADIIKIGLYRENELINSRESNKHIDRIVCFDNGSGMGYEELRKSHQLGSQRHYKNNDIGKFGLGGIIGAISIGRKVTTITLKDGSIIGRLTSLNNIATAGKLVSTYFAENEIPQTYLVLFREYLDKGKSGTMIVIDELDNITTTTFRAVRKKLLSHMGENYFSYLMKETLLIEVNNERVNYNHPIMWDSEGVTRLIDETFNYTDDDGAIHSFTLQAVDLTNVKTSLSFDKRQGLYFVRNDRLLCGGITNNDSHGVQGFWSSHADYRYFRVMVRFNSSSDKLMGVGFTKKSINWSQAINDIISAKVMPFAKEIKAAAGKSKKQPVKPLNEEILETITTKLNQNKGGPWSLSVEDLGQYGLVSENIGTTIRLNEEYSYIKQLLLDSSRYSKESGFSVIVALEKSFAQLGELEDGCAQTIEKLRREFTKNLASMTNV